MKLLYGLSVGVLVAVTLLMVFVAMHRYKLGYRTIEDESSFVVECTLRTGETIETCRDEWDRLHPPPALRGVEAYL